MAVGRVPVGGPASFRGGEYQLLWSLFHATQWKVEFGSDHGITAILEPDSGIDLEYRFGQNRRVEQIKARSTGKAWSFAAFLAEVLPSLYRCVDIDVPTAYVFVTETSMGRWQEAYDFFRRLSTRPVPPPAEMLSALDRRSRFRVGKKSYTEASLFEHVVGQLAGRAAGGEERLRVWHLLRGFHFQGDQDYSTVVLRVDRALANHGTPQGAVITKRNELIGDLFARAGKGNGRIESTGFFQSHGLSEVSLLRWLDVQVRAGRYLRECLDAQSYRRDWDVRENSAVNSLFIEEPGPEEVTAPDSNRPLVGARSAVLLTGGSGQGKSWQLFRLGYELVRKEQMAILIQGRGALTADLEAIAAAFCREIWGSSFVQSLRDLVTLVLRRELPELRQPWLTVLIDGVRDEDYALNLLQYPWQELGLRVVLGCRSSERLAQAAPHTIKVDNFTGGELSRYLKRRLGVELIDFPEDMRKHMKLPLFARLFCDLGRGTTWRPVDEYHLFERAWSWTTAGAPLAAAAVAGLAAHLPDEQVYPWPIARVWAAGLRDGEIRELLDSGLLRLANDGRSLEIWHDRILNWAVAEGLVSAVRTGEITGETLVSRAIYGQSDSPIHRRLEYVAMDTLWLLATPEFALDEKVRQFLAGLEAQWERRTLLSNLPTLGARIARHLFFLLESGPGTEEDE